jgi:proteasome lid subunit RPN8/RPN11
MSTQQIKYASSPGIAAVRAVATTHSTRIAVGSAFVYSAIPEQTPPITFVLPSVSFFFWVFATVRSKRQNIKRLSVCSQNMKLSHLFDALLARLFPKVRSYKIAPDAFATMRAMAEQTHPKEAFGVLRGHHRNGVLYVTEVVFQPFLNTTHSAHVAIDRYALSDMVGTFHSHPTPNVHPSRADLSMFAKHPGIHCIIGAPYNNVAVYSHQGDLINLHKL